MTLTLVLPTHPAQAKRRTSGGSDSGGGGSGMACFLNAQDAQEAMRLREQNRPVPSHLINRISTLLLIDYCENSERNFFGTRTDSGPGADLTYLDETFSFLKLYAPKFERRIQGALSRVRLDRGHAADQSGRLTPIDDIGANSCHLPSSFGTCVPIQIATRHASYTPDGKIQASVSLDYSLFDKLGLVNGQINRRVQIINQAMLRLHEALYLIGFGLGQKTSKFVRSIVAQLASVDPYAKIESLIREQENLLLRAHSRPILPNFQGMKKGLFTAIIFRNNFNNFATIEQIEISPLQRRLMGAMDVLLKMVATNQGPLLSIATNISQFNSDSAVAFMLWAYGALAFGRIDDIYDLVDPQLKEDDHFEAVSTVCRMLDGETGVGPMANLQQSVSLAREFCSNLLRP